MRKIRSIHINFFRVSAQQIMHLFQHSPMGEDADFVGVPLLEADILLAANVTAWQAFQPTSIPSRYRTLLAASSDLRPKNLFQLGLLRSFHIFFNCLQFQLTIILNYSSCIY